MFILSSIGIFVGFLLGARFTMLVLVPVMGVALAFAAVDGTAQGDGFWRPAFEMIAIAISVQFGYMLGLVVQSIIGSVRDSNQGTTPLPNQSQNWPV
jgi:hypothetical protein